MSEEEKTYEMLWDCEFCGNKKLLGKTHRHCANCGGAQNPEKRYFPPEEEKVAVEDHEYVGADMVCPACREAMSAAAKHCANCGSPMGEGAAVGLVDAMPPAAVAAAGNNSPATEKKGEGKLIGLLVVGAVIAVISFALLSTKDAAVEVTGHSWTRSIVVERYDKVEDSGDCKKMPSKAKVVSRKKGKKKCTKKKVDKGDGTYKEKRVCTEPVEQCTYTVKKWGKARTEKESRQGLNGKLKWPKVRLAKEGKCIGCEREAARSESYVVKFKDPSDSYECSYNDAGTWKSFSKGDKYVGEVRRAGNSLVCSSLKKN